MGTMVYIPYELWILQDLYHRPYGRGFRGFTSFGLEGSPPEALKDFESFPAPPEPRDSNIP